MAQHKPPPDSTRTAHSQKPFVRLSDIAIAYIIVLLFVVGVEFLGLIVFATLFSESAFSESANDILTLGALLFMGVVSSIGFGWVIYYLVRRKYKLQWSEIGLTLDNWQRGLLWALALFPIALLVHVLEARGWLWLIDRYSIRFLMSMLDQPEYVVEAIDAYHVVGICIALIIAILIFITEYTFIWGLVYNALERKISSVWGAISAIGLIFLVLSPLQFASACVITFAFTRTRTLLTPLTMAVGVPLFFQGIIQPTWYDPNRFTMHGTCICADDGTPLDNGIVTYDGNDYKNVTVVKWDAGWRGGKGKTTTTSSGTYTFQNAPPRGYIIKLTVTSTYHHQHRIGASASLRKCTYSHTEYLDVGDTTETVEKNFVLKPNTVETP